MMRKKVNLGKELGILLYRSIHKLFVGPVMDFINCEWWGWWFSSIRYDVDEEEYEDMEMESTFRQYNERLLRTPEERLYKIAKGLSWLYCSRWQRRNTKKGKAELKRQQLGMESLGKYPLERQILELKGYICNMDFHKGKEKRVSLDELEKIDSDVEYRLKIEKNQFEYMFDGQNQEKYPEIRGLELVVNKLPQRDKPLPLHLTGGNGPAYDFY